MRAAGLARCALVGMLLLAHMQAEGGKTDEALATLGTIADKPMARHLLTHALEAIAGLPEYKEIIVPASQVEIAPAFTTRDIGDIPMLERGTP